jgi:hypothetical protein
VNVISHDLLTDIWLLSYDGEGLEESLQTLEPLSDPTSFTILATVLTLPEQGGIGLTLRGATEPVLLFLVRAVPAPPEFHAVEIPPPTMPFKLRIEYHDGIAHMATSPDGLLWTSVGELEVPEPTQAGMILFWDPGSPAVWGELGEFRLLPGLWGYTGGEVTLGSLEPPVVTPSIISLQEEPRIHALIGAQFGDYEFDVGKSVRWTQWFVDDVHISDVNMGTQRYWVVNWAGSFPEVTYNVTGINFFTAASNFRKMQFEEAGKYWPIDDNDWVLFCDAHEALSCDTTSQPDDHNFLMFKPYLYREIARATGDTVVLPFFAFLRDDHVQNIQYESTAIGFDGTPLVVLQSAGVPYYLPYLGLTRLVRASALRDPSFHWGSIDWPQVIVDTTVKVQILSYGYAHWNFQTIPPGQTSVPELDESNDDGWRQRNLISMVRPLPGLPIGSWQSPVFDPVGERGPWAPEFRAAPPLLYPPDPAPPPISAQTTGVLTPLYHTIFRLNMRDGVWWEGDQAGNTPLVWDPDQQKWVERTPESVAALA